MSSLPLDASSGSLHKKDLLIAVVVTIRFDADNGEIFPDNADSNDDVDDENFYNAFGFQRSGAVGVQEEIADLDGDDCVKSNGEDND